MLFRVLAKSFINGKVYMPGEEVDMPPDTKAAHLEPAEPKARLAPSTPFVASKSSQAPLTMKSLEEIPTVDAPIRPPNMSGMPTTKPIEPTNIPVKK